MTDEKKIESNFERGFRLGQKSGYEKGFEIGSKQGKTTRRALFNKLEGEALASCSTNRVCFIRSIYEEIRGKPINNEEISGKK